MKQGHVEYGQTKFKKASKQMMEADKMWKKILAAVMNSKEVHNCKVTIRVDFQENER